MSVIGACRQGYLGLVGASDLSGYIAILRECLGGDDCAEPPFTLGERESQTLRLVAAGQSNKEIVRPLDISVETVQWHLKNLYGKLQVLELGLLEWGSGAAGLPLVG
ncbi:helix-turn-helix domain-containing protein [Azotobacter chroococcum]|uniref:helix-turn-helix domain-containing protein n=1 Tax=Azotobacter chroococcum TaxID=353 RepID=UPI001A954AFC|nr:helix-turn-helix transcriptional regulator [Azotobacter chroococcum]